jgi:hypothetical protein
VSLLPLSIQARGALNSSSSRCQHRKPGQDGFDVALIGGATGIVGADGDDDGMGLPGRAAVDMSLSL